MAIDKANIQNIYPLTPLQEGMYFHAQSEQSSGAYFEQWSLRIRGAMRADLVRQAWNELFRRHEVFRSVFTPGDGKRPLQLILRQREVELRCADVSVLPEGERDAALAALRLADRERGFRLDQPLVRLLLVTVSDSGAGEAELIWSHHHIILDGWSVGVVQREFIALYSALLAGRSASLAPAFAFSGFVKALPRTIDGAFWAAYLDGYQQLAELPVRASPAPGGMRRHYREVEPATCAAIDALCRQAGCTLSTFVQAAWGSLLARYANSDDVVFGYVYSGRPDHLAGVEDGVGLFINTLPVRVTLQAGESFLALLGRLHLAGAELSARQHTALADIQRAGGPGGPLFQHVLALENFPVDEQLHRIDSASTGFEVILATSEDRTHYDFDLVIMPHGGGLRLRFSYDQARHDDALIERIGAQLMALIAQALAQPLAPACQIDVLPPAQRALLLEASRAAAAAYPRHASIDTLFAEQAAGKPDAPALLAPDGAARWVSYGELERRASAVAARLRARGVQAGSRVALLLAPGEDAVVAMLGVLRAGCAYVPLDPDYPAERIRYILDDAAVGAIVTDTHGRTLLPDGAAPALLLMECADDEDGDGGAASGYGFSAADPDDTAYIIYTSGSTGPSKGCEVTHRNLVRLICNDRLDFSFSANDVWIVAHSLSFDFSVWEIFGALLHGARLVLPSRASVRDTPRFHALLREQRVTVLNQTPLAFLNLAAYECTLDERDLAQLRYVIFGGDRLVPAALRPWAARYAPEQVALVNMYGITETTVHVTFCRLNAAHLAGTASPIGRALPETAVYVMDRHLNLQPLQAPGELMIGGSGVCKGYWQRPELTAARFAANPFDTGRLYHSGDLGWRGADTQLNYLGRNDQQVKIRGHRIEPAEVEQALLGLAGIDKALVLVRASPAGSELSAYITGTLTALQACAALALRLPAHMLPASVVSCAAFPLTVNGKPDRTALLAMDGGASEAHYSAPQGANEQVLAEVWGGVLGVARVGRDQRYLTLGGDSIKSIQILARLRARGLNLQLRDLFQYPTVAELAPHLGVLQERKGEGAASHDGSWFDLAPIQLRFFDEHPVDSFHFNHAVLLHCPHGCNPAHLHQALQTLSDTHEALRLRFAGTRQRCVAPGAPVALTTLDLRAHPQSGAELTRHASAQQRSLQLEHGPLLRAVHYRMADGERLLIVAHHLIIDGVSWRILQDDLELALAQCARGQPVVLAPPGATLRQFAATLRSADALGAAQAELGYWQAADMPDSTLPALLQERGHYGQARECALQLSAPDSADLRRAGGAYQTNVAELLLAALAAALHEWSALAQIQIALEHHGRAALAQCDVSRTVGWFTAMYPLQLALHARSPERLLKEVKEALRQVPRSGVGYGALRYLGAYPSALTARPSICFNYLGEFDFVAPGTVLSLCYDDIGDTVSPQGPRPFALDVGASINDGCLRVTFGYAGGSESDPGFGRLRDLFALQLQQLVAHCLGRASIELTPSDLTYKALSLDELDSIFDEY